MKVRHAIIPAVYLLLQKEEKILLLRRYNTGYLDGNYSLIAGHLNGGEPLTKAVIREAYEEVGITIDEQKLRLIHVIHTKSEIPDSVADERVDFYFTVDEYSGVVQNNEPDKCDELVWVSLNNLPVNIVPRVKKALTEINQNNFFSEFGW
jgi:8-oxo-dGTP pyrophosphatase MutT (NUDIX family)